MQKKMLEAKTEFRAAQKRRKMCLKQKDELGKKITVSTHCTHEHGARVLQPFYSSLCMRT